MTVGNPVRLIIQFMIPMFLGNVFQQFYNIVDSIVAGQFIGVDALAAIGSTGSLMFFVTGFCYYRCAEIWRKKIRRYETFCGNVNLSDDGVCGGNDHWISCV